mgnify:CR=1 FL=1
MLACKWCQTEVSPQNQGRPRRYCSPECAKQAASREKRDQHRSIKGRRKVWKVLPCLKCGQAFTSLGPGNRLCKGCREENTKIDGVYARLLA